MLRCEQCSIILSHPLTDFSHLLQSHWFSFTTPQKAWELWVKHTAKKTTHKHTKTRRKKAADWNTYRSNNESQNFIGWFRIELGDLRERISHFDSIPAFSAAGFTEHGRVYSNSSSSGRASFIQLVPSLLLYGRCQIKLLCTLELEEPPPTKTKNK